VDLVHNDLYWAASSQGFTTPCADLSRKECDKRNLGRYAYIFIYIYIHMYVYVLAAILTPVGRGCMLTCLTECRLEHIVCVYIHKYIQIYIYMCIYIFSYILTSIVNICWPRMYAYMCVLVQVCVYSMYGEGSVGGGVCIFVCTCLCLYL